MGSTIANVGEKQSKTTQELAVGIERRLEEMAQTLEVANSRRDDQKQSKTTQRTFYKVYKSDKQAYFIGDIDIILDIDMDISDQHKSIAANQDLMEDPVGEQKKDAVHGQPGEFTIK